MSKGEKKSMFSFLLLLKVLLAVALVAFVAGGIYFAKKKFFRVEIERKRSAISAQILQVAELTAIKYQYTDVVGIKKTAVAGMSRAYSIVKYTGVIRIGIEDLTRVNISIGDEGKSVTVTVPKAKVLENALLHQEVFDEKDGVFVSINTAEVIEEITKAMADKRSEISEENLLVQADKRVGDLLTAMLKGAGFEEVKVKIL